MKSSAFCKSSAWVSGQIGPVKRARVSDLVSFDLDRPAGPSQRVPLLALHTTFLHLHLECKYLVRFTHASLHVVRHCALLSVFLEVQQRGVEGTASILEAVVEGCDIKGRVYVVDMTTNRCCGCNSLSFV